MITEGETGMMIRGPVQGDRHPQAAQRVADRQQGNQLLASQQGAQLQATEWPLTGRPAAGEPVRPELGGTSEA